MNTRTGSTAAGLRNILKMFFPHQNNFSFCYRPGSFGARMAEEDGIAQHRSAVLQMQPDGIALRWFEELLETEGNVLAPTVSTHSVRFLPLQSLNR